MRRKDVMDPPAQGRANTATTLTTQHSGAKIWLMLSEIMMREFDSTSSHAGLTQESRKNHGVLQLRCWAPKVLARKPADNLT